VITIQLNEEDALVLFEFLARHDDLDSESGQITGLGIEDPAELYALFALHGALECTLVDLFSDDYQAKVGAARAMVRTRWGAE